MSLEAFFCESQGAKKFLIGVFLRRKDFIFDKTDC